jgi:hypothetical protein
MDLLARIKKLTQQLLPTGRAFRLTNWNALLNDSIAISEAKFYTDAVSLLDSLMPDTDRFLVPDCELWERILGLPTNGNNTLAARKAAIYRKMSNPGINPAKAHYLVIQEQLQLAGFNVWVYENMFPDYPTGWVTQNPAVINPNILTISRHGGISRHGMFRSAYINHVVANSIYNSVDIAFNVGDDLNNTFFIGGATLGAYATVDADREVEFRQLILQLKQTHKIAYLFVTYTP